MDDYRMYAKQLNITRGILDRHHYQLDTAFDGRYLRRLPDRTLVPAEKYAARLEAYEAEQHEAEQHKAAQPHCDADDA